MAADQRPNLLYYTAADAEFFEPYARRAVAEEDFVEPVRRLLPPGWSMHQSGLWAHCGPDQARLPEQGWKIHVSSVLPTARIVLSIAAAALASSGTSFKFAADMRVLASINSKRWPRSAAGKFITVYPLDVNDFRRLVDDLRAALSGYAGPYILSDRRCVGSRVVHYRYGGMAAGQPQIGPDGRREWLLRGPDGTTEPDVRAAFFRLPAWLRDPLAANLTPRAEIRDDDESDAPLTLGAGRYEMRRSLAFSAAGGVYLAHDLEQGKAVVIKEARPGIGGAELAVATLRKEFRLLRTLAAMGITPAPVQHFVEWEHHYLVEEYIEGQTLRQWLAGQYPWLKTRATQGDVRRFLVACHAVFTQMATMIEQVHAAGISLGDASFHNFMVQPDGRLRMIDLEAAVQEDLDRSFALYTPGFASPAPRSDDHVAAMAEDRYAFGANLFAAIMPTNALLPLDRSAAARFLRMITDDMGYPAAMARTIMALLDPDPSRRPALVAAVAGMFSPCADATGDTAPVPHRATPCAQASDAADALFGYIDAMAQHARADRFVPADPAVFEHHPWGLAHGAAGVLHAYQRGSRMPPAGLRECLIAGARAPRDRGSDLMHGDAGIAWVLFDAGETALASALLGTDGPPAAICRRAGLFDGLAGWGMVRIAAWRRTDDPGFLAAAIRAGEALLASARDSLDGTYWDTDAPATLVGLGHGASGVALFLLHLALATGQPRFMPAAHAAMAFDLAQHAPNPDGDPTWRKAVGRPGMAPYRRYGTAGIMAVVARFALVTGDTTYRDALAAGESDLLRRHAISPGLCDGLAGIGETLLDLASLLPDRAAHYLDHAHRVAAGMAPFLVRRPQGLAVPGAELLRLSCDLATGNAGVGAFFDRLWRGAPASFMLDENLPVPAACVQALPA